MQIRRKLALNPGPGSSLLLLFVLVSLTILLAGWLALRLLMAASGSLGVQHGFHMLAEDCLLMLKSPDLADRLLAYSLLAAVGANAVFALWTLVRQLGYTYAAVQQLRCTSLPLPAAVAATATKIGLAGRVKLIESEQPFAFCYGLLFGRICVSTALLAVVGQGVELEAVLLHERYHLRHHDPLKMAFAAAISRVCFLLPLANDLYRHYLAARELAADQATLATQGASQPLTAALYRLVTNRPEQPKAPLVAQMLDSSGAVLNARFDALLGKANPYPLLLPNRHLLRSGGALLLLIAALLVSYAAHGGLVLMTIGHWLQGYC